MNDVTENTSGLTQLLKKDSAGQSLAPRGARAFVSRLKHAIETGVYSDGEQLPPERELATAFNTSRSTVRKVLDQLESNGLVMRRAGSGTFVNYAGPIQNDTGDVTDLISPLQMMEARLALEPRITRLAALHATQRDLDSIEEILNHLENCDKDKNEFTRWDSEFHLQLARCSRNPLLLHFYQQINSVRTHAQWNAVKERVLSEKQIAHYNIQHRDLFHALSERNAQKATEIIEAHLEIARQDLIGAAGD